MESLAQSTGRTGIIKGVLSTFSKERAISSHQIRRASVSNELAYRYFKSGWLKRLERGVFVFSWESSTKMGACNFWRNDIWISISGENSSFMAGIDPQLPFSMIPTLESKDVKIPVWFRKRCPCLYTSRQLFEEPITQTTAASNLSDKHGNVPVSEPEDLTGITQRSGDSSGCGARGIFLGWIRYERRESHQFIP